MKHTPNNIIGIAGISLIGLFYVSQILWGIGLMLPDAVPHVAAEDPATEALAWLEDIKTNQIAIQEAKDSNRQLVISIRKAGYEVDWSDLTLHRVNFDKIDPVSDVKYWEWQGAEDYKNVRLRYYQDLLRAEGITNTEHLRNLTAQLLQENGSLDPVVMGDWTNNSYYCSLGIPQINMCVHHGMDAATWLARNPEWKDWKLQMEIMTEWTVGRYEKYDKDIFQTVLGHNCPSCASAGWDNGYWKNVQNKELLLTLI
jgi:hypothetical protein